MFEPDINIDPRLLPPYGVSPRGRIPPVAPKTPQEETRDVVGVAPNVELREQSAGTPITPITPVTAQTSVTPEFKSVAPKPTSVIPPNREGQPVSAGEFIPEPTAVTSTPTAVTSTPTSVAPATTSVAPATKSVAPTDYAGAPGMSYEGLGGAISNYKKKMMSGADYFEIDDVDLVGGYYDKNFTDILGKEAGVMSDLDLLGGEASIGGAQAPSERIVIDQRSYLSQVDAPEYISNFSTSMRESATQDATVSAFSSIGELQKPSDVASGLSNHYGYEIKPIEQNLGEFGGNLRAHTSSSKEKLAEFHSLVEPILTEQLPYLQAVEGMTYQEALKAAYDRDPMLQALYYKYGVNPLRYTDDGSEYLYDPFSFSEIRTIEVKDDNILKKILKVAPSIAAFFALGPAGASLAAATGATGVTAAVISGAIQGAASTALTGGDTDDILKSAALGGLGGLGKGLNANAADLANKASANAFTLGAAAPDPSLLKAANAAAKTADTFNKIVAGAKFVDAAADGNLVGAILAVKGPDITKAALDKVGFTEDFLSNYNINRDDLEAGLNKTQMELAKGADFGDAIARGFGEYIKEGGALGPNNVKTPEFIKRIGDAIAETGRNIDDLILQPVKDTVEPVIDVARDVGRSIDDKVLQPVKETVQEVTEPITKPIVETTKEVGRKVDDELIQPVKETIEEVYENLPEIDVNLPEVDVDVPSIGLGAPSLSAPFGSPRSPRYIRDTGYTIFDKGERGPEVDIIAKYLAGLDRSFAAGGAAKGSYGSVDELLRIVGGK